MQPAGKVAPYSLAAGSKAGVARHTRFSLTSRRRARRRPAVVVTSTAKYCGAPVPVGLNAQTMPVSPFRQLRLVRGSSNTAVWATTVTMPLTSDEQVSVRSPRSSVAPSGKVVQHSDDAAALTAAEPTPAGAAPARRRRRGRRRLRRRRRGRRWPQGQCRRRGPGRLRPRRRRSDERRPTGRPASPPVLRGSRSRRRRWPHPWRPWPPARRRR